MPIYEYFCPDCNTVFSFFSSSIRPEARPDCPRCRRPQLERKPSRFAALTRGGAPKAGGDEAEGGDEMFPGVDESRLEGAMEQMAREMEGLPEDQAEDPRQMARFFRRFGEMSGLEMGPKMEDMIRRLEAGEDPESLEDGPGGDPDEGGESGPEGEDWGEYFRLKKKALAARAKPKVDETLYFL